MSTHRRNLLLAGLSAADYALLKPHLELVSLPLGTVFYEPEAEIERVYFPHSGVVSVLTVLLDGSEVECCTMGNETAFGLLAAREASFSFTREIVQIAGEGSSIRASDMRAACQRSASLQTLVDRHLRVAMSFMARSVACNARHKLEARLCRWILTCADYVKGDYLPLTQEFIAAMLGVQRTSVTDAASGLQEMGLLRVVRGKVTVLDQAGLKRRSCECYEATRSRINASLGPPIKNPPVHEGQGANRRGFEGVSNAA